MADLVVTKADVRPLPGAIIRGGYLGEAASVGDVVAPKADGLYWKSNGGAVPVLPGIGVITAVGTEGAVDGIAGNRVSVQLYGPIAGFTVAAATKGWASGTAGKIADAAPATPQLLGVGLADNVFLLFPNMA